MKFQIYLVMLMLALFSSPLAQAFDQISGYKGAKWGASYQKVKSAVKTTQLKGNCLDFYFTLTAGAPEILKKYTSLVGVSFSHSEKFAAPYNYSKNIKYKPVDTGCGLFYKDKFVAYQMVLHTNSVDEVRKTLAVKYGEPKVEANSSIFEQRDGRIFLFELRTKSYQPSNPHLVYVAKDLKFMIDDFEKAKKNQKLDIEKEQKQKQKKLNDL